MSIDILMPALSPTMTEGTLARWLVKEGDSIRAGDVIAEIETDKATMEVEASDDGVLGRIVVPDGSEKVAVNSVIGVLLEDAESADDIAAGGDVRPSPSVDAKVAVKDEVEDDGGRALARPPIASVASESAWDGDFKQQTVREALRDAMAEEMRACEDVFLMGEEVAQYQGAYKVSQGLLEEFGDKRVIDTPITEIGFTGLAVGSAFHGLKPIVEFMTFNFAMQAIDHIINSAAKTLYMSGGQQVCSIVFRGPNGAASRVGAQHSQCYGSWYAHCPGLKVVAPYSAGDAKALLKSAIRDPNPVVFLEHELLYGESFDVADSADFTIPIGRAAVLREGSDVTLTAFSYAVGKALRAAEALAEEGISAEVIDLRSLRPLDIASIIASVKKTNRLVNVEDGWGFAGIGAEIAGLLMEEAFDWLDAPVLRVYAADVPLPYAANLEKLAMPQIEDVVVAAKKVCYR